MFGIGLPEMIVILAVALIVVGPDKLPDMARTIAKWVFELKKTVNQVKESLEDEDNLIGSVKSDLKETEKKLKNDLLASDHFDFHEPGGPKNNDSEATDDVIDIEPGPEKITDQDEMPDQDTEPQDGDVHHSPEQDNKPE